MSFHANDNFRSPEEHRRILAEQRQHQPGGEPETVKAWPSGTRYMVAGKFGYIRGLNSWNELNGEPVMCVANDNVAESDMDEWSDPERMGGDNLMDTPSADGAVARHAAGKSWKPTEESFERPHKNDEPPPPSSVHMWKRNNVVQRSDVHGAEDEMNRAIDCKRIRARLGPVCCLLLDMASGDSTLEEIGAKIRCGRKAASRYVDQAIEKYLREAA